MQIPCDFDPDKGTIKIQLYDIQIVKMLAPNEAKQLHEAIGELVKRRETADAKKEASAKESKK